ncbi:MAG: cysteine desulfurase family protein [Nanoarchaeota archaeon]
MKKKKIYLDNSASTKVDEKVLKAMIPYFSEKYANASSKHEAGQQIREVVENSRKIISKTINAKPNEIIFTSGGTESNNFALKGLFFYNKQNNSEKNHIITTKIEHASILETCKWFEKQGAKITYLDVDEQGFIDLKQLEKSITKKTFLVSIIHGNNEIGTIQDLEKIGKICKEKKVLFHTDACQSFTKIPIDVKKLSLDLISLNSHKIHGPKGVGALYIKESVKIIPLIHGGGHEFQMRSGTENVSGIIGFAEAVKIADKKDVIKMKKLQNKLIEEILRIPNTKLNGSKEKRLCNNVNVSFKDIDGETIASYLEKEKIYISTGSACQSHESSHVLKAIGLKENEINGSIRISLSKYTTEKDIDYFLEQIKKIVEKLRKR